jgi:hypothetical protein
MLDKASAFLRRCCAARGNPLVQSGPTFELAVETVGLLATRRGRLRDYFEAVAALGGGPGDAAAAGRPACCTAERAQLLATLRKIAVGQFLGAERPMEAGVAPVEVVVGSVVTLGFGRIVALHHRPSTLYQIH